MIRTSTLNNGLQVVTEAMSEVESVALSFWVGTGSRDETSDQAGMSHFLEHLLFKGSKTRSALDIAQAIDGIGGDMNAFTTKECTSFYVRVLHDDLDVALDILCDIMCAPAFDKKEIEAERQVVLEEILMRNDEPADLVHEQFAATFFKGHQLGRDILGAEERIETMRGDDIEAFFDHHYRAKNLVFAAAGHLDHDEIVAALEKRWSGKSDGSRPARNKPTPSSGDRSICKRETDQVHLVLGVPAPSRHDHDRYGVSLLDIVLGGGMSSRLFQEVREKRGLAYTVYSSYSAYDDAGEMTMYVATSPKRAAEALNVMQDEAARIAEGGVTEEELSRAKRNLRATSMMNLEDTTARMSRIGRSLLLHGDVLTPQQVQERIDEVTVADLQRLTAQLFSHKPVLAGVGRLTDRDLKGVE